MKIIKKTIRWVVGVFFASTILLVVVLRFIPVYITPLMLKRQRRVEHETKFIPTFSRKGQDYAPSTAIGGGFRNGKSSFLF